MNQVLQMKLISEKQWHELQCKIKQTTQSMPAFSHSIYEASSYEEAKLIFVHKIKQVYFLAHQIQQPILKLEMKKKHHEF